MSTETAMMLAWPEGRLPPPEAEPVTDLYLEWIARLPTNVLERRTQVLFTAGKGAKTQASEHSDELARRERNV